MYPTLISLGPVAISTNSVFMLLSFLTMAFVYWRRTKEEHYSQDQAFDAFLLSAVVGLIAGRVSFMLLNFAELGRNIWHWFDVVNYPGSLEFFGLLGASLYLYRFAGKQKWDQFEVLDFWFLAMSAGMVLKQLGNFFAGTGFGNQTNLPWGVVFPGVFNPHHPAQLYSALFFLGLYIYLSWAENHYRTFIWYRAGKKTAQTGFLTCVFLVTTGIFNLLMILIRPIQLEIFNFGLDYLIYGGMLIGGGVLLYLKSGRSFLLNNKKSQ